jgi:FlaA1/EpsC-like NDP-sugar epimerase
LKVKRVDVSIFIRQVFLIAGDIAIINFSTFLAAAIYFNFKLDKVFMVLPMLAGRALPVTALFLVLFYAFGLYSSIWKYAGLYELVQCTLAGAFGSLLGVAVDKVGQYFKILNLGNFPPTVYIISMFLIIGLCGAMRLFYRMGRRVIHESAGTIAGKRRKKKRIMLVGAGDMGMIIARELAANGYRDGKPVVMVDDNRHKQGKRFNGIPVRGGCARIPEIAEKYSVDEIIICIPSAPQARQLEIMNIAMTTNCVLKTSPSLREMADSAGEIKKIRSVEITDLLARPEVNLNIDQCRYLTGKTVLVTGCGSIGSELCRQAARHKPKSLILVDNYENNAFNTYNELYEKYKGRFPIHIRIGSVQDVGRLREIFSEFRPDIVFHAAAHKHVPLMEDSPCEAVKNNIFGTYNTAKTAMEFNVQKFIILSTDKAVNPANVMGATKRITELIIQYFDKKSDTTDFAAVRFGNVLGSNGSVIPIFKHQIENGGPVTVTDPEITRYFMTISEAAQLVIQAGSLSKGGEVFVLDMGEQIKILTLAENLIKLSGYEPYKDIDINFTGLRPGEKLYEELSMEEEIKGRKLTANDKIFVTPPVDFDEAALAAALEKLRGADEGNVREYLKEIVPNFVEAPDYSVVE